MTKLRIASRPARPRTGRPYSPTTRLILLAGASLTLMIAGCKAKPVDDATLNTNVHSALAADKTISQQPVQVAVQGAVVTLTGNVSDDTASSVAAQDAAKVKGVKEVVNDLTVAGIAVAPTVTSSAAPELPRPTTPEERQTIAQGQSLPSPAGPPPPPPAPTYRTVTVPAGTSVPVRITQTLDSGTTQTGARFNGVVAHEVVSGGLVVIPAGSAVSGRVVEAKDAGHFKGNSVLSVELTSVRRHGDLVPITTDAYTLEGKGRGKNSAAKIGGGAAIGAVLGGIFGGGKGAAIGAGVGGGGGAAVQGFTRGQQVQISSESLIRFRLASSFNVRTAESPSNYDDNGLRTR